MDADRIEKTALAAADLVRRACATFPGGGAALAANSHITPAAMSQYRRGRRRPSATTLRIIAAALQATGMEEARPLAAEIDSLIQAQGARELRGRRTKKGLGPRTAAIGAAVAPGKDEASPRRTAAVVPEPWIRAPEEEAEKVEAYRLLCRANGLLQQKAYAEAAELYRAAYWTCSEVQSTAFAGWCAARGGAEEWGNIMASAEVFRRNAGLTDADILEVLYWEGVAAEGLGRAEVALDRYLRIGRTCRGYRDVAVRAARILGYGGTPPESQPAWGEPSVEEG